MATVLPRMVCANDSLGCFSISRQGWATPGVYTVLRTLASAMRTLDATPINPACCWRYDIASLSGRSPLTLSGSGMARKLIGGRRTDHELHIRATRRCMHRCVGCYDAAATSAASGRRKRKNQAAAATCSARPKATRSAREWLYNAPITTLPANHITP